MADEEDKQSKKLDSVVKELKQLNEAQEDAAFDAAEAAANQADSLPTEEQQTEAKKLDSAQLEIDKERNDVLEKIAKSGKGQGAANTKIGAALGGALKGFGSSIGVAAGGIGLGVGAAMFGAAQFLEAFNKIDGKKIKENILEVVSIKDEMGESNLDVLAKGGTLYAAMLGIGAGLATFSIGAGVAAGVSMFTSQTNFAATIKEQLLELLSIADHLNGTEDLKKGGALVLALTGIGFGLAVFGAGSAVAGISDGLKNFVSPDFANNIKQQVITLLSISDELGGAGAFMGDSATFLLSMIGIGAGLAVFGAGTAIAGVGAGLSDGIAKFSDSTFAQNIKDSVITLLSIKDELGGNWQMLADTTIFAASMAGIAYGLAYFGVGSAIAGIGTALANFTDPNWAKSIVANVIDLLSIKEYFNDDMGEFFMQGGAFGLAMAGIGAGLAVFGTGSLISSGAAALGKLFGKESPMDKIIALSDRADSLFNVKPALQDVAEGIDAFGEAIKGFGTGDQKAGVANILNLTSKLTSEKHLAGFKALADIPDGFSMQINSDGSATIRNDNMTGANLEAANNQVADERAGQTGIGRFINNVQSRANVNNVSTTQVNQSFTPERDMTLNMYGASTMTI